MDNAVPVCETDSGSDFSDHTSDMGAASLYLMSSSTQSLNDEGLIEILDSTKVVEKMTNTLTEVASIIGEDLTVTRLLLTHFKWDTEALVERSVIISLNIAVLCD